MSMYSDYEVGAMSDDEFRNECIHENNRARIEDSMYYDGISTRLFFAPRFTIDKNGNMKILAVDLVANRDEEENEDDDDEEEYDDGSLERKMLESVY